MTEKRVLIAYGTRYGSTEFIAKEIGKFLEDNDAKVEIIDVKSKRRPDPEQFDLIIVGSSVAMYRWVRKAIKYLKELRGISKPYVVYVSCGTAIDDVPMAQEKFVDKFVKKTKTSPEIALPFAPVLDLRPESDSKLKNNKMYLEGVKEMAKEKFNPNGFMDLRDMDRFNDFLQKLQKILE